MPVHKVLGPILIRFDLRSLQARPEALDARRLELIANPFGKRILRSHRNQIDCMALAPCNYRLTTRKNKKTIDRHFVNNTLRAIIKGHQSVEPFLSSTRMHGEENIFLARTRYINTSSYFLLSN